MQSSGESNRIIILRKLKRIAGKCNPKTQLSQKHNQSVITLLYAIMNKAPRFL